MNQAEKKEVIRLIEQSALSVKANLRTLGISSASFYQWYKRILCYSPKFGPLAKLKNKY